MTNPLHETIITAAELASNLADILSRAQERGERFVVTRHGKRVAALGPGTTPQITWGEFALQYRDIPPPDDQFANDLEVLIASPPRINLLPDKVHD